MARPGIMIYFDILEPVKMLSDADRGRLLMAMLEYGRDGVVPKLEGPLAIVWSFIQPKIDRDEENYDASKLQRQYAAFCKKRKKIWMPRIPFDEWVLMSEDERERAVDAVESRTPSTSTSASTASNSQQQPSEATINHQPSSFSHHPSTIIHQQQPSANNYQPSTGDGAAAAAAEKYVKSVGGELGKGVVFLSDRQVEELLGTMGIDCFDYYVDKLANFIIRNDAKVANHCETILKWWRQDGAIRG